MFDRSSLPIKACVVVAVFLSLVTKRQTCELASDSHLSTYDGVTVVIKLTDGKTVNCLGTLLTIPSLIEKRKYQHVLTSASCVKQASAAKVFVYLNGNPFIPNKNKNDVYKVTNIMYHPSYNEITHTGDVALLRMHKFEILPPNVTPYKLYGKLYFKNDTNKLNLEGGTMFWKTGKATKPFYASTEITYLQNSLICPFSNDLNGKNEKEFGYMFICSKLNKIQMDIPGAMLMGCKQRKDESKSLSDSSDSKTLSVLGFYSYSYVIKGERIVQHTLLYWYYFWIQVTLKKDWIQIEHELLSTTTTTFRSTTSNYTKGKNSSKHYYDENIKATLGPNPCGGTAVVNKSLQWIIYGVVLAIILVPIIF